MTDVDKMIENSRSHIALHGDKGRKQVAHRLETLKRVHGFAQIGKTELLEALKPSMNMTTLTDAIVALETLLAETETKQ